MENQNSDIWITDLSTYLPIMSNPCLGPRHLRVKDEKNKNQWIHIKVTDFPRK